MQPRAAGRRLVRQDRYFSDRKRRFYLACRFAAHAHRIFHRCFSETDRLRKANRSSNGGWLRKIRHDDRKICPVQPQRSARGKVSGSPNQHKHIIFSFNSSPAATGQCRYAASSRASASSRCVCA